VKDELPLVARLYDLGEKNENICKPNQPIINHQLADYNPSCVTEFSNISSNSSQATKISNACNISDDKSQNFQSNQESPLDLTIRKGNLHLTRPKSGEIDGEIPKYYINNPPNLMKSQSSGGVEAATTAVYSKRNSSSHTVRLSISPSQGDDPGFKSRPEHS
jgi:hypothetical protein